MLICCGASVDGAKHTLISNPGYDLHTKPTNNEPVVYIRLLKGCLKFKASFCPVLKKQSMRAHWKEITSQTSGDEWGWTQGMIPGEVGGKGRRGRRVVCLRGEQRAGCHGMNQTGVCKTENGGKKCWWPTGWATGFNWLSYLRKMWENIQDTHWNWNLLNVKKKKSLSLCTSLFN